MIGLANQRTEPRRSTCSKGVIKGSDNGMGRFSLRLKGGPGRGPRNANAEVHRWMQQHAAEAQDESSALQPKLSERLWQPNHTWG